jgi:uncharacterized protein YfbU (UPF0304 family)
VKKAIYSGNAWALRWQYPGIFDSKETSESVRKEVLNILDLWSFIEWGYEALSKADKDRVAKEGEPFGSDVYFRGFDGNNEGEYLNIAAFLIDHLNRFTKFTGRDLNSHAPSVEAYRRMWVAFEPMRSSIGAGDCNNLGADQIITILKEMLDPDHR